MVVVQKTFPLNPHANLTVTIDNCEDDDFASIEFEICGCSVTLTQFERDKFAEEFLAGNHTDGNSYSTKISATPTGARLISCDPQGDRNGGSSTRVVIPSYLVNDVYLFIKETFAESADSETARVHSM